MVAALAWMDVFENCNALLLLDAPLEDSSDTVLDEFSVDDCVCSGSTLDLSCLCFVSRQILVY